jgi:hypothetical protein
MTPEESFKKNVGDDKLFPNHTDKDIWFSGYTQCQEDMADNWLTMKEGDITINFKPMPEFDEPIGLLNSIRANPSWDTIFTEFHIATQQVEIGRPPLIFECWLVDNYNPPTKKQDNE